MAKYTVEFLESFEKSLKKLDRETQRKIMKWINQHLHNVDFPTKPGKVLTGNLDSYVRFRPLKNYRVIALVEENIFKIICVNVGHRSDIYKRLDI
ncbi:type II toxin-antitoxin system mRNA interferase toxin, RelE/StbE family [Granulicatella sp. zg-ZJ]|uniref:type II toxin-antitoxin system RelE family toxin n=1 Tax=Granulicatella sp. zg-ZJ TaxID=2678504 RepID=UPI0013D6F26E|nr:type II toxin-antitoxin system RelE/ParE family toxin [Granulicatella sp. zg-ZJ]MBS4749601.1 type II toxin-antitoxin system RelE/ParE family toxin [Carnobacteriaceae bacterium zg-ZUI78]NEW62969.1 type II toxin-antitoxin system mRNA interferase toxin, RelE/StbE family [Granulicatella sp. zg-ZJ]